jgi:hypothetical protein
MANGRFQSLVANGSNVWWPMEGEGEGDHFFTSFHFPSKKFI